MSGLSALVVKRGGFFLSTNLHELSRILLVFLSVLSALVVKAGRVFFVHEFARIYTNVALSGNDEPFSMNNEK